MWHHACNILWKFKNLRSVMDMAVPSNRKGANECFCHYSWKWLWILLSGGLCLKFAQQYRTNNKLLFHKLYGSFSVYYLFISALTFQSYWSAYPRIRLPLKLWKGLLPDLLTKTGWPKRCKSCILILQKKFEFGIYLP